MYIEEGKDKVTFQVNAHGGKKGISIDLNCCGEEMVPMPQEGGDTWNEDPTRWQCVVCGRCVKTDSHQFSTGKTRGYLQVELQVNYNEKKKPLYKKVSDYLKSKGGLEE